MKGSTNTQAESHLSRRQFLNNAGPAALVGVATVAPAAAVASMPMNKAADDSLLIESYSDLVTEIVACNAESKSDEDVAAHMEIANNLHDQIVSIPARTLAGIAIKCGLALDEHLLTRPPESDLDRAARSLLMDLKRLTDIETMPMVNKRVLALRERKPQAV